MLSGLYLLSHTILKAVEFMQIKNIFAGAHFQFYSQKVIEAIGRNLHNCT
jgi:hypothetical protein